MSTFKKQRLHEAVLYALYGKTGANALVYPFVDPLHPNQTIRANFSMAIFHEKTSTTEANIPRDGFDRIREGYFEILY